MPTKRPAKKTCFVIGPIGSAGSDERRHADMLLNAIIREVLEKSEQFDYQVKRADKDADPGMINDRMIHDILNSDLAIADLSFLNPNAFWELGLRHSAMKPVIHIAADGTKLPFDNIGHRAIFVDLRDWDSQEAARKALGEAVKATQAADYRVSNPITQANASFQFRQSADTTEQMLAEAFDEIRQIKRRLDIGIRINESYLSPTDTGLVDARMPGISRNALLDLNRVAEANRRLLREGTVPIDQSGNIIDEGDSDES